MSDAPDLERVLRRMRLRLRDAGLTEPALEARLLVQGLLGLSLTELIASADIAVAAETVAILDRMAERRAAGEPVGRILGRRDFHGLTLELGPDTLEPRPDTEILVDEAVGLVRRGEVPGAAADGAGLVFLDIGTGSGAVALAMLDLLPSARGIATDLAPGALDVAGANAARLGLAPRLQLREGSYLDPVTEDFGLIVSNPPYIARSDIDRLDREVREHDPRLALDGGPDGLDAYRVLVPGARERLLPGGTLLVEIGFDQAEAVSDLFVEAGYREVRVVRDLGARHRVVLGRSGSPAERPSTANSPIEK